MGRATFPPCCLSWEQTKMEVMKIMATSFKRSHAHNAALSAPDPAAGHHQPMPLPDTPGHSQASLGLSFVGSLLFSPGSWCSQGFVCALKASVSPVLCKFCKNPTGLQSQIPWDFSVPLPDPQAGKSVVGPRTFLTVWECLWHNCSAVCGLSAWWLYGGVNGDLQDSLCDQVAAPRAPAPAAGHCWPITPQVWVKHGSQTWVWFSLCGASGSW